MSEKKSKPFVICICGPTCGGKTTLCNMIIKGLTGRKSDFSNTNKESDIVSVLGCDRYYKGGDKNTNYDVPESMDFNNYYSDIHKLLSGDDIDAPIYDFTTHSPKEDKDRIKSNPILILEGILTLYDSRIRDICDLKIYVSAERELRYERRMKRDTKERGRTEEEVRERYFRDVLPSNNQYVEPLKNHADMVLNNNHHDKFIGADILLIYIKNRNQN